MAYQSEIEKLEQRFGEKPEQWFAALADAYRKAGDLDMALDILNTWIEKRPNYTSGHIVRGRCLVDRQQDAEAAQAFQGVLELDPENIIAIKALSDIATRAGNEGQARHWLQRLLEVDPMNEDAHAALEALSAPAALEPSELPSAEAAAETPPEEPAALTPQGARASGAQAPFDPMAIAQQKRDSDQVKQVTGEPPPAGAEAAPSPAAPPDLTVETAPEVEGLETSEVTAEAAADDAGAVDASGLKIEAFDEEMGWDAGERISHAISQEDLQEALEAHENSLDVPAHALPGIEAEEVPAVGVEEREAPAVEGLDVPPQAPEEEPEPVSGFEPTVPEGAAAPVEELPTAAETVQAAATAPPEAEVVVPAAEPAAAPTEAAEETRATGPRSLGREAEPEAEKEEELPLILPDEVRGEEEAAAEDEPEPLLTETMAEVYVAQGHLEQAREIYRELLVRRPGDAALAAKLADLESRAAPRRAAPVPEQRFAAAAAGGASVSSMLAEILGVEPRPAAAPPPRPAGWKPSWPAVPAPPEAAAPPRAAPAPEAAAPPATKDRAEEDFSFDEFFGDEGSSTPPGPSTRRAAEEEGSDDDFRSWLKSLKT